jgi:hypothetical protein
VAGHQTALWRASNTEFHRHFLSHLPVFEIDVGERLAVAIAHDKAGVQFLD